MEKTIEKQGKNGQTKQLALWIGALVSLGKRAQSYPYARKNDASHTDGTLHEKFSSNPASHHEYGRDKDGRIQEGFSICIAYLHHHRHGRNSRECMVRQLRLRHGK